MVDTNWLLELAPFCHSEDIPLEFGAEKSTATLLKTRIPRPATTRVKKVKNRTMPTGVTKQGWDSQNRKVQEYLVSAAMKRTTDNIARRHAEAKSAAEFSKYELAHADLPESEEIVVDLETVDERELQCRWWKCYGCSRWTQKLHSDYIFSCVQCGSLFASHRHVQRPLPNTWTLVTGGRTKLGYQIALKLLRAGAHCIPTTRQPDRALVQYRAEPDSEQWWDRLHIYPPGLDLMSSDLPEELTHLYEYVFSLTSHLDVLVNCAAQTIRSFHANPSIDGQTNRYGDPAKFSGEKSSWCMQIDEVPYDEWKEVFAVNAIAPAMILSQMLPLLRGNAGDPEDDTDLPSAAYVLNVHAREGLFSVEKGPFHIHTNMAKAALAMLTRCCSRRGTLRGRNGKPAKRPINVHGVDPGWISTDEYYAGSSPWLIPPIDDVDGAARVLQPLWEELRSSSKTRRHFNTLQY